MTNTMDELYSILCEQVNKDPEYQKKRQAMSLAILALVEQLERQCGERCQELLDVIGLLDAKGRDLHEQLLFRAAVRLEIELGQLVVS